MKPTHPNKTQKTHEKAVKQPKQVAAPRITYHPLSRESKRAIEFHFEKGSSSLKIIVLDKEQSQANKMIKPRKEAKVESGW